MNDKGEAVRRFRRFHGRNPSRAAKVFIPFPKAVIYLGEAIALEYRSDKLAPALGDGPKSRKTRTYRHKTGRGVKFYTDPKGRVLFVTGGRFKVTDWLRH